MKDTIIESSGGPNDGAAAGLKSPLGASVPTLLLTLTVIAVLSFALLVYQWFSQRGSASFSTTYQAVLLDNGSVYFGHLENANSPMPILRDVYYVQTAKDATTNEQRTILIRRGKELHAPDYMVINRQHILFVEPVTKGSRIEALIEELKKQQNQGGQK